MMTERREARPINETVYKLHTPVTIALLADLHGRDPAPVLSSLAAHRPQLIAVCGDILFGSLPRDDVSPLEKQADILPFLSACASLAPSFLALGNHEYMLDLADLRLLSDTGVTVLDNDYCSVMIGETKLVVGGLTSAYVMEHRRFVTALDAAGQARRRYPKTESLEGLGGVRYASRHVPETAWLKDFAAAPGDMRLLLSHHPEYFPLVPEGVDMTLSGHAHGGQIRLFRHGLWCPGQGFWPRWTKGVYDDRLIVSAGLSNTTWIPRLFNPVEIVYITS